MNKAFLICPVRDADPTIARAYVEELEANGWDVYWPFRDTDQQDNTGLRICQDNRLNMFLSDVVFVLWDGKSQGCLFDLGMAFAMRKKIRILSIPKSSEEKSFQNMIYAWQSNYDIWENVLNE